MARIRYVAPKRKTYWVRHATTLGVDTQHVAVDLLQPGEETNYAGSTVTRIRGRLIWTQTASNIENRAFFGMAVRQRSDASVPPGTMVVPEVNAIDDANTVDWMWWDMQTNAGGLDSATGVFTWSYAFDVRSQRIINSVKESLLFYLSFAPGGNSQHVGVVVSSALIKRP